MVAMKMSALTFAIAAVVGLSGLSGCSRGSYMFADYKDDDVYYTYRFVSKYMAHIKVTPPDPKAQFPRPGNLWSDAWVLVKNGLIGFIQKSATDYTLKYKDGSMFSAQVVRNDSNAVVNLQKLNSDSSFTVRIYDLPGERKLTHINLKTYYKGNEVGEAEFKRGHKTIVSRNIWGKWNGERYLDHYQLIQTNQSGTRLLEAAFSIAVDYNISQLNRAIINDENTSKKNGKVAFDARIPEGENALGTPLITKKSDSEYFLRMGEKEEYTVECQVKQPEKLTDIPKDLSSNTSKYSGISIIKFNKVGSDTNYVFNYELINHYGFICGRVKKTTYFLNQELSKETTDVNTNTYKLFGNLNPGNRISGFKLKNAKESTFLKFGLHIIFDEYEMINSDYKVKERFKLLSAK